MPANKYLLDTMKKKSKYQRKNQKSRDCTKCKNYRGFISKNYFVCEAEIFVDQPEPSCRDIYDRDVLKKGTCNLFVPIEVGKDDNIHANVTLERRKQENDQYLPDKE